MKKIYTLYAVALMALLFLSNIQGIACEACKKQQPKLLQGITHGGGPESNWDYLIVTAMVLVTLYVLVATIRCMLRPAEKDAQHIKRMILNQQQ